MKRVLASLAVATLVMSPMISTRAPAASAAAPYTFVNVCATTVAPGHVRCFAVRRIDQQPVNTATPNFPSGYHPADLLSAYNLQAASSGGSGQVLVDVLWNDDPSLEHDLNVYRSQFGLPACTTANGCFKKVNQNGGTNYPPPDSGIALEYALDVDMFSAICPKCHIVVVEANTNFFSDIGIAENQAVKQGATVISNSYGAGEGGTGSYNHYYNHPGVAITVSSGDGGYGSGPQWPANTQFVTAVGGTSLYSGGGTRGWTESVWGGAGSGCSQIVKKPSWQKDPKCHKRTIADVSAVADPNTGVAVYDSYGSGGWTVVGGTSVSSPLIAGVYGLAGNASTVTYGSYPYSHVTGNLYDITSGSNGGCGNYLCNGVKGYDGPSGLGTPNGTGAF